MQDILSFNKYSPCSTVATMQLISAKWEVSVARQHETLNLITNTPTGDNRWTKWSPIVSASLGQRHSAHSYHVHLSCTSFNPSTTNDWTYPSWDFEFSMSLPVTSLGILLGSRWAKTVREGEVGGCTQRVQTAWWWLSSALKRPWLVLCGPLSPPMHVWA